MATKILPTESVKQGKGGRWLIFLALGLVVAAVAAIAGLYMRDAADRADRASRIGAGVTVGDLNLAGMTEAQATDAIAAHFASLSDQAITLKSPEKEWSFTAIQLGVSLDAAATARAAHQTQNADSVHAEGISADVPLVLKHDNAAISKLLDPVAQALAITPISATLSVSADGIKLSPSKEGRRLDAEATATNLAAAVANYPFGSADVVTARVQPTVLESDLQPAFAQASKLSDAAVTVTLPNAGGDTQRWILRPEDLRRMLIVGASDGKTTVADKLNADLLNTFVASIAPQVQRDPTDATLSLPDYAKSVTLTPEQVGRELDQVATAASIQAAAQAVGDARSIAPALKEIPAKVTAAQLQPVKDNMDKIMADGVTLTQGDKSYKIEADQVVLKLYLQKADDGSYSPLVYDADMSDLARAAARKLNTDAVNAAYRLVDGATKLATQPADGYEVDQDATAANIKDAFMNGKAQAELVGGPLKPTFADTSLGSISTPDNLGQDSTSYAGSSPERNWNVTLGAERLDGWYVPPGAVFSVNEALGPLTLDAGFKMGWAILVSGGNATTIPSEAGGICQVVTTLFHPLFWAGLPFTERHHHSYWIAKYGIAPMGLQGLDATIDPPWSDLKFKNTTGNWMLIRANGDHTNVTVSVWGTKPDWKVQVDAPVISNVVKTDTKMRYEKNDQVPEGKTVVTETAQDGFDVDIHRRVYDATSGAVIDDWHAQGTYLPAHNTTVTGTGKAVPGG